MSCIVLNWHKSNEKFPEPGQEILVITADCSLMYGSDSYRVWKPIAVGEDGLELDKPYSFFDLAAKDFFIPVVVGDSEWNVGNFIKERFLWMAVEDYEVVFEYLGLEKI